MSQKLAVDTVKLSRAALLILVVVMVAVGIGGVLLAKRLPFSKDRVRQTLQASFPATLTFREFHSIYFPHPGCVAEGVVFRRLGSSPDTPPIVTIQHLSIEAHYIDLVLRPGYLARIVVNGFRIQVPPPGTPLQKSIWTETSSTVRVGEIIADGAVIEIARADPHGPLRFEIHALKLTSVSRDKPMSYAVALHNALPPGEIRAHGQFGPWNSSDPGQTPVAGQYTFQDADLGVFKGVAGTLFSEDRFQGILEHIEAHGSIDVPDFRLTRSDHSVHLTSDFDAVVNGTNGDVELQQVNATFLKTRILAIAKIVGQAGQPGKTTSIDLTVRDGHIDDVLRLFIRQPKPPLNGVTSFRAHVVIPSGKRPFLLKVRLSGEFGIQGGQFTTRSTQMNVDTLSEKARGAQPDKTLAGEDLERVISNLAGHVELREATATFTNLSFAVPGALAQMHGTYKPENQEVDLHGTLKTDAEFSKMSSGFKSALLKPFDSFFKRKHVGAVVPVHLVGTYDAPQPGLDLPTPKSSSKPSAVPN